MNHFFRMRKLLSLSLISLFLFSFAPPATAVDSSQEGLQTTQGPLPAPVKKKVKGLPTQIKVEKPAKKKVKGTPDPKKIDENKNSGELTDEEKAFILTITKNETNTPAAPKQKAELPPEVLAARPPTVPQTRPPQPPLAPLGDPNAILRRLRIPRPPKMILPPEISTAPPVTAPTDPNKRKH